MKSEWFETVNGIEYRVSVYGNGWAIAIDIVGSYGSGAFWQDQDAEEPMQIWDEHGFEGLVRYANDYTEW